MPIADLQRKPTEAAETSETIRNRVRTARIRQEKRFKGMGIRTNKEMSVKQIDTLCPLDRASEALLRQAVDRLGLSARSYHRTIKVARTIADLAGDEKITAGHIAEALQFRQNIRG